MRKMDKIILSAHYKQKKMHHTSPHPPYMPHEILQKVIHHGFLFDKLKKKKPTYYLFLHIQNLH